MGNSYTNVTLRGPTQQQVTRILAGRRAIVTPPHADMVVVYDAASEAQDGTVTGFARTLSKTLVCAALAVTNHDDSVLCLQLFHDGELVDEYNSCPGYFEDTDPSPPAGGNPSLLCEVFGEPGNAGIVEEILRVNALADGEGDRYVFETKRHEDLARSLGLPLFAVGFGYDSVAAGEAPEDLNLSSCSVLE